MPADSQAAERLAPSCFRLLQTPHRGQHLGQIMVPQSKVVRARPTTRKAASHAAMGSIAWRRCCFGFHELARIEIQLGQRCVPRLPS